MLDAPKGWARHAITISQLVSGDFQAVSTGRNLRLITKTIAHFRAIQAYLQEQKLAFYTFARPAEKLTRAVVRGLPTTVDSSEVQDAVAESGFDCLEAKQLKTSRGQLTSLWLVTLKTTEGKRTSVDVFNLKSLLFMRVTVTRYRPCGPAQCHRCQGFGHGSSHCSRPERCVRCGEGHSKSACPKAPEAPASCCNCGLAHTANYKGCEAYKREKFRTYAKVAAAAAPAEKQAAAAAAPAEKQAAPPATQTAARGNGSLNTAVGDTAASGASPEPHAGSGHDDDDGFTEAKRRRHRQPRNPANRGPSSRPADCSPKPSSQEHCGPISSSQPAPLPQRATPHRRIDWPVSKPTQTVSSENGKLAQSQPVVRQNPAPESVVDQSLRLIIDQLTSTIILLKELVVLLKPSHG